MIRDRNQMALGCGLCVAAVIGLVLLLSSGCATWPALAHEAAKATSAKVEPHYRAKCIAVAKTCPRRPAECPPLEACLLERRKIDAAILAVHAAIKAWADVAPLVEVLK